MKVNDNDPVSIPWPVLLLLALVMAVLPGCGTTHYQARAADSWLDGVAIQHPGLEPGDAGTSTSFKAFYNGDDGLVQAPGWLADPRYDSRQLRKGPRTWWLATKDESTTDEDSSWTIARGE